MVACTSCGTRHPGAEFTPVANRDCVCQRSTVGGTCWAPRCPQKLGTTTLLGRNVPGPVSPRSISLGALELESTLALLNSGVRHCRKYRHRESHSRRRRRRHSDCPHLHLDWGNRVPARRTDGRARLHKTQITARHWHQECGPAASRWEARRGVRSVRGVPNGLAVDTCLRPHTTYTGHRHGHGRTDARARARERELSALPKVSRWQWRAWHLHRPAWEGGCGCKRVCGGWRLESWRLRFDRKEHTASAAATTAAATTATAAAATAGGGAAAGAITCPMARL